MAFSLIHTTGAAGIGGSSVTTGTLNTTGYNLIVVQVADYQPNTACTLTDSKGNAWTSLASNNDGSLTRSRIFYCLNPTVGASHSWSISGCATITYPTINVVAIAGSNISSPFDAPAIIGVGLSASTTGQPGSITPSQDNSLILAFCVADYIPTNPGPAPTISAGYSILESTGGWANRHLGSGMAYQIQGTAASTNPTWSYSGSTKSTLQMVTIKPLTTNTNQTGFLTFF